MGIGDKISTLVWMYRRKLLSALLFVLGITTYALIRQYLNECADGMIGNGLGRKVIACVSHYFFTH
jgi:hypothetical protein